jgi:hypothetical protein
MALPATITICGGTATACHVSQYADTTAGQDGNLVAALRRFSSEQTDGILSTCAELSIQRKYKCERPTESPSQESECGRMDPERVCGAAVQDCRSVRYRSSDQNQHGSNSIEHVYVPDVPGRALGPLRAREMAARHTDRRGIPVMPGFLGRRARVRPHRDVRSSAATPSPA